MLVHRPIFGLPSTFFAMQNQPNSLPRQQRCLYKLASRLERHARQQDSELNEALALDIYSMCLRAMKTFSNDLKVQAYGSYLFCLLAALSDSVARVIAHGDGLHFAYAAMYKYPQSYALRVRLCSLIRNLTLKDEHHMVIVQSGGVRVLCDAMMAFPGDKFVQMEASDAMCTLSSNDKFPKFCAEIARLGGVELVCRAMERFPHESSVQEAGCCLIHNMVLAGNPKYRELVVRAGGIQLLVNAMALFSTNSNIQSAGCTALSKFSLETEVSHLIIEAGGIPAIVHAMKVCVIDESVQKYGCSALHSWLSSENVEQHGKPSTQEMIEAARAAMRIHPTQNDVWRHACAVLICLEVPRNRHVIAAPCA